MKEKKDLVIKCRNCGKEFNYTVGEQKFYEEKGFPAPVRCKECREARKANQNNIQKEEKKADFEELLEKFRNETVLLDGANKNKKSRR